MSESNKIVAEHWSQMVTKHNTPFHWTDSKLIMNYINQNISGDKNIGWLGYACQKYLIKNNVGVDKGLSIGCGTGALERQCLQLKACQKMEGFDIAPNAIEEAIKLSKQHSLDSINYEIKDIENLKLEKNSYDVVFASSSIHHIKNLEHLFEEIKNSLKKNGYFIMLEYVGPNQFQFSAKVVDMINLILSILSPEYRKSSQNPTKLKEKFTVTPIKWMNEHDPSEAIRSSEIVPIISNYFTMIEKKDFGGSILHMLLQDIIHNFNLENSKDHTVLSLIILIERILISEKILSSDFTFIVARNNR